MSDPHPSVKDINPEDLKEVIGYIGKIKDYDRSNFSKLQQVNDLVWGLLFLFSGVMDGILRYNDLSDYTPFPWAFMSFSGMFISIFINSRSPKSTFTTEFEEVSTKIVKLYRSVVILTVIAWILMTIFIFYSELYFLILPLVSLLIGSSMIGFNLRSSNQNPNDLLLKFKQFYDPRNRIVFIASLCFLATIINIVGYLIDPLFILNSGLVMGGLLAFAFGSGAFVGR